MRNLLLVTCGVLLGGLLVWFLKPTMLAAPAAQTEGGDKPIDLAALDAEVTRLKGIAPTQSHVMADTALQFSSLWFAGQKKNWPLATFLFNETRGRIRWTIRINPKPKAAGSQTDEVDLQSIFDGIDMTVLNGLKDSIEKKDSVKFEAAYRQTIEACYACHKSTNRPFLRPMIPTVPGLPVMNFDPAATWPQ